MRSYWMRNITVENRKKSLKIERNLSELRKKGREYRLHRGKLTGFINIEVRSEREDVGELVRVYHKIAA